jgi:galactoside O-acetyltransferase
MVVGDDVWIAEGATLLGGITVGEGAVIGAHAVVTKDVPPRTVVAGNPARVVKEIGTAELRSAG